MSALKIYDESTARVLEAVNDHAAIARRLEALGVQFERWQADGRLGDDASDEQVIAAYRGPVDRLIQHYGFKSMDVVSLRPDHPKKDELRAKFLDEHTHSDFEVRFFVDGQGLFYIHTQGKVYAVLCEQGDLISVPANTTHWFDMGERPSFRCIRLFTTPEGWVAQFTGNDIARRIPDLDDFVADAA